MINSFSGKYRFLSNFFPVTIMYENIEYGSVEHAFQATKTTNISIRKGIADLPTPGQAKRAGRLVDRRSDWEQIKFDVMYKLLKLKFENIELKKLLLDTGDQELIEGNHWNDQIWGVCRGVGENHLGKLLMKVRQELRTG